MARSDFYLVERPDPKYGTAHIALRQIRRQGRIRQSLLPEPEDRQGAGLRAPLGDLCGRERGLDDPAWLVWLATSHGRSTANRRELRRPRGGTAAPAESDRHAASLASAGLDLGRQCAASGDRRLRGLDAGRLSWSKWLKEPATSRRTSLGQATGGRALRLIRPTVATMWCAPRENQISQCPRTRRFWATPRGTIPRTCLSWRSPHATCFGICIFAPMPGLSSGPMKIAHPAACSN